MIPAARNSFASASSVSLLPRPRMRDITCERFSLVKTSAMSARHGLSEFVLLAGEKSFLCKQPNDGAEARVRAVNELTEVPATGEPGLADDTTVAILDGVRILEETEDGFAGCFVRDDEEHATS